MNSKADQLENTEYPAAIRKPCPRCGKLDALRIGQVNFQGKLRWFESVNCEACGLRSEADGIGFPPPEIREWLVESDGEWCVVLTDVHSTAGTIKVLRSALSLDIKAASALLKTDSKIIYRGSKSESLWLADLLKASGEAPTLLMSEN